MFFCGSVLRGNYYSSAPAEKELGPNLLPPDVFPVVEMVKNALAAMTISALVEPLPGLRGEGVGKG